MDGFKNDPGRSNENKQSLSGSGEVFVFSMSIRMILIRGLA